MPTVASTTRFVVGARVNVRRVCFAVISVKKHTLHTPHHATHTPVLAP